MEYWKECAELALEDAEIKATKEQIETIASWIENGHETYGQATGHECIPDPRVNEIEKLKQKLKKEENKRVCEECNGKGSYYTQGPYHGSSHDCHKCGGKGFIY